MRFFASVGVVVHHSLTAFGPPLTDFYVGAAGVDVFFIISGVVIGYADHREGALVFVAKRFIRMVPLYWLATLACGAVRFQMHGEVPSLSKIAHSLTLVPDFSSNNWFPIYNPGWTLSVELAFYGLFASLLACADRSVTTLAAIAGISLCALQVPVPFVAGATFGTSYFFEFSCGLIIAEAIRSGYSLPPHAGRAAFCLGLAILGLHYDGWQSSELLGWGLPAVLLVLGALGLERNRLWRSRLLEIGGSASYAIYLFHLTTMEPLLSWLEQSGLDLHSSVRSIVVRELILVGSSVAVGVLIHLAVERPMLSFLRRHILRPAVVSGIAPGRTKLMPPAA